MDAVPLVENQIDGGQRLLDRLGEDGFEVVAACWVKPVDEDRWSLYVASPVVDRLGTAGAYREAHRSLRALEPSWVTYSDLKVIGERHPVAQNAAALAKGYAGPTRSRRPLLGDLFVEEVYVYPLRATGSAA